MTSPLQSPCVTRVHTKRFTENGQQMIRVPLFGKRALGRSFVLDADVWRAGRQTGWPAGWIINYDGKSGREYVVSFCKPVCSGNKPAVLARIIAGARAREVVSYVDNNTFNLRAANLRRGRTAPMPCVSYLEVEEAEDEAILTPVGAPPAAAGPDVPPSPIEALQPSHVAPSESIVGAPDVLPYCHAPGVTLDDLLGRPPA